MDVFAEVKRIESEAERLLSEARESSATAVQKAHADAAAYREAAAKTLESETSRLNAEHRKSLAEGRAAVEAEAVSRKARLDRVASRGVEPLADWVAESVLKG